MLKLSDPPDSYQALCQRLQLNAGIPFVKDWSAAADFLQLLADTVHERRPATILECGSGLSTLILARACQLNQSGRVICLENSEEYAGNTRQMIDAYDLSQYVTVVHAPLASHVIGEDEYQWYALHDLPESKIELLVIDGPPGFIQKNSRYPAIPLLFDGLADNSLVLMDDAARPDELEIVGLWKQSFPGIESDYVETERGCARLPVNKDSS